MRDLDAPVLRAPKPARVAPRPRGGRGRACGGRCARPGRVRNVARWRAARPSAGRAASGSGPPRRRCSSPAGGDPPRGRSAKATIAPGIRGPAAPRGPRSPASMVFTRSPKFAPRPITIVGEAPDGYFRRRGLAWMASGLNFTPLARQPTCRGCWVSRRASWESSSSSSYSWWLRPSCLLGEKNLGELFNGRHNRSGRETKSARPSSTPPPTARRATAESFPSAGQVPRPLALNLRGGCGKPAFGGETRTTTANRLRRREHFARANMRRHA